MSHFNHDEVGTISNENNRKNILTLDEKCLKLLKLERKVYLTQDEFQDGVILFKMLSKVSENPLDYCEVFNMAKAWEDLGTGELTGGL